MVSYKEPIALEIPVTIGNIKLKFFINENLYVSGNSCSSYPHNHHGYELRYVLSGSCNQVIGKEKYTLNTGDILIVRPLEYHFQVRSTPQSAQYNMRFTIEPPPDSPGSAAVRDYNALVAAFEKTRYVHDENLKIKRFFQEMAEEITKKQSGYILCAESFCRIIFVELLRFLKHEEVLKFDDIKHYAYLRSKLDKFFRGKHLLNTTIEDLAEDMKVSARTVNRTLNKMYSMSYSDKIVEIRLHKAAYDLIYTDKSIYTISSECAFKHYGYFYSRFKKCFGTSPSEFRAINKEKYAFDEPIIE